VEKDRRKDGLFVYDESHSKRMALKAEFDMLILLQKIVTGDTYV
jgi:hypothetical protein